ncbi:MAG TPA: DinB family protein [Candidatus Stackebrandtia excrementipullorum]|nr:DinB family protein [Candidatus Stackebrandtia excrementipullorum]
MTGTDVKDDTDTLSRERSDVLASLAHARHFLRFTARGLTTEQALLRTTASALTIAGLIKHVTAAEKWWADFTVTGGTGTMRKDYSDWTEEDFASLDGEFVPGPDETLEDLLAAYDDVAARTDALVRRLPSLDDERELPNAPWFAERSWSARRVLQHIVSETAQHAGHADIIRESLDGSRSMG